MKVLYVSLGQASVTDVLTMAEVKDKQHPVFTQSVKTPVCSLGREGRRGLTSACFSCIPDSESYALSSSLLVPRPLCSSVVDWDRRQGAHSPNQEMTVYHTETEAGTTDQGNGDPNPQNPSCYSPVEQLAVSLMERILRDVGTEMDDRQVTMGTEMDDRQVTMETEMDDRQVTMGTEMDKRQVTMVTEMDDRQVTMGTEMDDRQVTMGTETDDRQVTMVTEMDDRQVTVGTETDDRQVTMGTEMDDRQVTMGTEMDKRQVTMVTEMDDRQVTMGTETDDRQVTMGTETDDRQVTMGTETDDRQVTMGTETDDRQVTMGTETDDRQVTMGTETDDRQVTTGTEMDKRQVTLGTEMDKRQVTMVTEMDMSWSSSSSSGEETGGPHTESPCEGGPAASHSRLEEQEEGGVSEEDDPDLSFYDGYGSIHGDRQGLGEFKEFLKGTPGEKLLRLWMDIERLNTLQDGRRKNRHLVQMRSCYLLTSGQSSLNGELLTRLGLSTSPCWRENRLQRAQPRLTEALLCYWGPRFRLSQRAADPLRLSLWRKRPLCYPSGVDPNPRYTTLHPLTCIPRPTICPDTSLPRDRTPTPGHTQTGSASSRSSSSRPVLGDRRMERMLQALHVDSRAGFYFTHFCERSGNQLWENAVHFWWDLQQYHQLFYQDGLDPYRVQRQAHLLYSTYVCSAACRSIGVEEESRGKVYTCLTPPFEELFDGVEEHTLTLLLEPWTLLTTRDTDTYQKVGVWEEARQVETEQYRRLQTLYEEAVHRLEQHAVAQACRPPPPPLEVPRSPAMWSAVPERYRGYGLGSLLGHRMELQHFTSFLQDHNASIHLACWLDIEHYRRIPHKDKAQREDESRLIKDKYLNRKYLFGPDSPATRHQQDESIIRNHIETRWLPVFLTTPAFTERQQQRVKPLRKDGVLDQVYQRHRNKREVWKQREGTWMTSAGEILALRRALLNPITCHQFRRFVSLKGDFLENDILFWLEVQRYKDLCHSHCLEAVVQDKVSTIISCFIQSSIPPALQIDIPPEQAAHILERRREMGPYVFREAQMCVFSELLKLWPEFLSFSSSVEEEEVLPVLENRMNKQNAKLQRRRRREEEEEEERRAQEEVERFSEEEKHRGLQESRELLYPSQQLSWSYSKYMVALEREEVLLRRQAQLGVTSFSTGTDSSSAHSLKSKGSRQSRQSQHHAQQCSVLSPRTDNGLV
ncbi:regulator of G-protein signaling 22-like [Coregonus clupeaformis]|uniref:regulator of G-protein signaling 22-like n=1 Tax=Coregonus clupeaformis TaxID=59861 RepID=UPI001E1C772D|nr:regulator of G-protein signaling 22-like [Coregonus clupeaformis]